MSRFMVFVVIAVFYVALDLYLYQAIKLLIEDFSPPTRKILRIGYFVISIGFFIGVLLYSKLDPKVFGGLRVILMTGFFITLIGKLLAALFLFADDLRRLTYYLIDLLPSKSETPHDSSRSEFMAKSAMIAGAVPIAVFSFGILSGAHDYRVRKRTLHLKNLPKAFDGIRVVQISDIHTGSFFNRKAVAGGVDLINAQKPDIVFFTGDLVNNKSEEAKPYLDIFKKVKGDMGVFSTMGNHDYGDYSSWTSQEAKQQDIKNLHEMHHYMGWDLLLNENRTLKVDNEEIAILGLENWGAGRFSKYGDMQKTVKGTEEIPFKLLLSHDPSHWDAQVRPEYPDVALQLAGHTHGMQFGIEIGDFRWSPSQYLYKQWADLYQEGDQYIYVNRGFGFIGYPGRVGILPEITVLELKRSV
ncbi:MAG: metallophosphoesterase [Cyclobacteriaceae bacterium]